MRRTFLHAKIHRATVTGGRKDYPGSITIGRNMLYASHIEPYELVHVNNVDTGAHWETYVIPGDDGEIVLNGAPSHHFKAGDKVVIMAFAEIDYNTDIIVTTVYVDEKNAVTDKKKALANVAI